MKKLTLLFLCMTWLAGHGQMLTEETFDFWVGDWELNWDKPDGTKGKGVNNIVKILDGKVIQENFEDAESGFKGMSLSVFNPTTKKWHQAWADNKGGYYDFDGAIEGETKIFKTKPLDQKGKKIIQRMVFKNMTYDSFIWDWERTENGGETWKLLWRVNYKRKK